VDIWYWLVVVVVLAVIGFVMVSRRTVRSRVDPTDITITPELAREVRDLYMKNKKLEAVKALREATGLGLADAVRIADKLGATGKPAATANPAVTSTAMAIGPDHQDEIRSLVAAGQQIQAIKKVRELTGMGLKDAKDYVDKL
jgi:ribosomal protein L7/L12